MIVTLIGCHGAGKSTLGRALRERLGWLLDDEIGARLAADERFRPIGVTAQDAQEAFDEAVFREELARDEASDPSAHRLVETWHPGNLSYALARSPAVALRHRASVLTSIARRRAAVIEVMAPWEVLARRQSEPGSLAFFLERGVAACAIAAELGLPRLARVSTHGRPAEEIADEIAPALLAWARKGGAP